MMKMTERYLLFLFLFAANQTLWSQHGDSLEVSRQLDSLIQISRDLTGKKAFDKALETTAVAEQIALARFGRLSAAYGSCCFNRGRVIYFQKNYPEAEKWYLESRDIREKVLGREHADYAWSLNNLGRLYEAMGQNDKAESLYLESKSIRENVLGKEHADYISSLNNLALLYYTTFQYDKAELLFTEVKGIRGKTLGKEHPDYASTLTNLTGLYHMQGRYEEVEQTALEALPIWEKKLGKEHPNYASTLYNLCLAYTKMAQYERAEQYLLKVIHILEKTLGKEDLNYAKSLGSLANLYKDMSQYDKAESWYLESKKIFEISLGKERAEYGNILGGLAGLYMEMGRYGEAKSLFWEVKSIYENALGRDNMLYALSLNNLGISHAEMGKYDEAELFYLEAKAIREKIQETEHSDHAHTLKNLATIYIQKKNYEKADSVLKEVLGVSERVSGREHPFYASLLNNLGVLNEFRGQTEKAESLYLESKSIWEKTVGIEHPNYAESLFNLSVLYKKSQQYAKAEPYYLELAALDKRLLEKAINHLSEKELGDYLNLFLSNQNERLSFAQLTGAPKIVQACYDNTLFYKGFLLNAANQVKRLAYSDTVTAEKFDLLKSYERLLAQAYGKPVAERDSAAVAELEDRANTLQKELARTVAGFGEAMRQVNWQEVQAVLHPGEAAVEFVRFRVQENKQSDSMLYAALVLHADGKEPTFVSLFEEEQLDALLFANSDRRADYVNQLYTAADRGVTPLQKAQKTLYELLWKPLEPQLQGVQAVYYAPSGLLHRLNLAAIPVGMDSVLSDRHRLVELGSTRQIVISSGVKSTANDALCFGGIRYDADSTETFFANTGPNVGAIVSRGALSFAHTDSTLRAETWTALPFTEREITGVEKTLKSAGFSTQIRRGYTATEEAFKTIGAAGTPSPRVLHLATHGYFFPDPKENREQRELLSQDEPVFKISDHPMIRSGLLLAGANHAWTTGKPVRPDQEDGILTAYEISQMNLSNTELVVLSACETGLGDIQGNEGVYGLQRAFKIAGARYIIMSLWQVPDKQTSMLMTVFYRKWMEDKMEIPAAFRAAQKELRELGFDPYQWAGFVLVE